MAFLSQMVMNGTEKPFTPDYEGLAVEEAYELPPPPSTEGSSKYSGNRISARSHEVSVNHVMQLCSVICEIADNRTR